jgi:hypothetical protein
VAPDVYRGLDGFDDEAAAQIAYFSLKSPPYAGLLETIVRLIAQDARVRDAILEAWSERVFASRYERALLLCTALRFGALRDCVHPLAPFVAHEPPDAAAVDAGLVAASLLRPSVLASIRERYVQTNEVTRAVAWRWPLSIAARGDRPAAIVDLGCSAGLNLVADRIDLAWTDSTTGERIPVRASPIVARIGFDRALVDVREDEARLWLRAAIWPGQTERLARFDAACARVAEARASGEIALEACEAGDMPARLHAIAAATKPPALVVAYQTVVRDYLLPSVAQRFDAAMREWLQAWRGRAIWCELERPLSGGHGPAELRALVADTRGALHTLVLGSGEYHPTALEVNAPAASELEALTA